MLNRILGIVGWLGTALVFAAVVVRFSRPEWDRYAYWAAWAGLTCVLLYMLGQWREIARWFQRRQARFGTIAVSSILIVLGILVAINYLASRQNKRWDLTTAKQFSLSDQTRKVLENLDAPVRVLAFDRETDLERFKDRLREYEYVSKKVSTEYIDADKKPVLARQYQIQSYGTVVFEYKGRTERVVSDTEQDLTNGLIKVVTGEQKKVYFVQGHGEKDTASSERNGYSATAAALGRENYTVEKLVVAQQPDVPADASVVVAAGPTTDWFPQELDAARRYLRKGGKMLFLLDPPEKPGAAPMAGITGLLKDWAIEIGNSIVVDASGMGQLLGTDASVPVAANYPTHAITDRFNIITAYPLARAVTPVSGGSEGRVAQTFVETSQRSWAETDIQKLVASGQVALEEDKGDKQGPISIAVAVSATAPEVTPASQNTDPKDASAGDAADTRKPETRLAVIGDSDFAANFAVNIGGNSNLFMNTVNWLAQQENLIAIRPRQPDDRRITLTADQQSRLRWLSLFLIPGFIFGSGVYTWWQRR